MKDSGIMRNVDELGRIVLPKPMRTKLDIKCGDPLEICIENGSIVLSKYSPGCLFCGSMEDVSEFKGKRICKKCVSELKCD